MSDIVVTEFVSLDGVIEAPGGEPEYPHSGWTFKSADGDAHLSYKLDELMACEAHLLGRVTYEGFAAAWRHAGPVADRQRPRRRVPRDGVPGAAR